jgi:hypothetical protein
MKNFSCYIVVINIYALCCFSWRTEVVNLISLQVPEQSLKQLKKKKQNHVPIPKYPYLGIGPWRTRPCHRAYSIRGSTPFHSCVKVRSPKLVSRKDGTGARAPSASYCSTEGVAPLHTAPPVPVERIKFLFCFSIYGDNRTFRVKICLAYSPYTCRAVFLDIKKI